jgi:hypothetical protein
MKNKELKQETLEEAAENNYPEGDVWTVEQAVVRRLAFMNGANWEAKKSYSEEEASELVYNIIGEYAKHYGIMIDGSKLNDLFEKFKKK